MPQSVYVDELASDGIMLEGIAGPPDQGAMSTPRAGAEHRDLMLAARRTGSFGVMVSDTARGAVRSIAGRMVVRYDLHADDAERFRRGFELLARIFFAAGAREVIVPIDGAADPARRRRRAAAPCPRAPAPDQRDGVPPARHGARRSRPGDARSWTRTCSVHDSAGVYVADGSVVPSSLGVNPQITIMALAARLARRLSA